MNDVFTGQEFLRPIKNLPAKWMLNVLIRIARRLSPSTIFGLLDAPHILTPLAAGAQCINIAKVMPMPSSPPEVNPEHKPLPPSPLVSFPDGGRNGTTGPQCPTP